MDKRFRRDKYPGLVEFLKDIDSTKYELKELVSIVNEKFKSNYTEHLLWQFLWRHNIGYKRKKKRVYSYKNNAPLGYEYKDNRGYTRVKIGKNKWMLKHRMLYEKYHNVKLTRRDCIVFMNSNKDDFSIDNLKLLPKSETGVYAGMKIKSDRPDITNAILDVAKLKVRLKIVSEGEDK